MQIVNVEAIPIEIPLKEPFFPSWLPGYPQNHNRLTLIKVYTDEKITGYSAGVAFLNEGKMFGDLLAPFLIGRDPFAVEEIIPILRNATYLGFRVWFVEIALWDIIGKATKQPIYKLLGGARNKILAYASTGEVREAKRRVEDILHLKEKGFKAAKLRFHSLDYKKDLETAEKVREAVGEDFGLMVDGNQGWPVYGMAPFLKWDFKTALTIAKELKNLNCLWLEEPLYKHDYEHLKLLREKVDLPIAGGEMNADLHEFRDLINMRCFDILQPDATLCTGILNARKVAGMAEAAGIKFAPHTWTNGIGLAANLQIMGAVPNCEWAEYPIEYNSWVPEVRDGILTEPITVGKDGYIKIPDKPGLGIEIDEEKVKKFKVG